MKIERKELNIMERKSLIRSLQVRKQRTFFSLLVWAVLATLLALTQTAFAYQEQEKPSLEKLQDIEAVLTPTAFTYQGQLKEGRVPGNGIYDLQFILYTAQTGGDELGYIVYEDLIITNGLFRVQLDFGSAVADNQESWLETAVRLGDSTEAYTVLSPRQRLTPTPYAIFAQQEPWSLIGVPVGFVGGVEKDAVTIEKVNPSVSKTNTALAAVGTANYIAKFDSSGNATVNSIMFDNGTNVGIGTTQPNQKLQVVGGQVGIFNAASGTAARGLTINPGLTTGIVDIYADNLGGGEPKLHISTFSQRATANGITIDTGGSIGVGTTSPSGKLHVNIGSSGNYGLIVTGTSTQNFITFRNSATPTNDRWIQWIQGNDLRFWEGGGGGDRVTFKAGGNVGIGTSNPLSILHVVGDVPIFERSGRVIVFNPNVGAANTHAMIATGHAASPSTMDLRLQAGNDNSSNGITIKSSGNVGIGTTSPNSRLAVVSTGTSDALRAETNGTGNGVRVQHTGSGGNAGDFRIANFGNADSALFVETNGIGPGMRVQHTGPSNNAGEFVNTNASNPNSALYVRTDGTGPALSVEGRTRTEILEITGGSDLAEPFEISKAEAIQPGMVVAIDPERPGQLRIADEAYDRTVAGIVSGANGINPGLTMKQQGTVVDGSLPVSLTGRVYCWADASYSPIEPGDLLTTSDTPGHAMKVTNHAKAQGAIIGKAMTSLPKGRGLVLVLVTLQ